MSGETLPGGNIDVLIAEDNEVNQVVFSFIMEEIGLSFEIVDNGEQAVAQYQVLRPALIVMDISMPVMNGFEATARIREMEQQSGDHTPIIAATAHALKGDRERCIEAGMDDYISKPISPDKLKQKLVVWMNGSPALAAI